MPRLRRAALGLRRLETASMAFRPNSASEKWVRNPKLLPRRSPRRLCPLMARCRHFLCWCRRPLNVQMRTLIPAKAMSTLDPKRTLLPDHSNRDTMWLMLRLYGVGFHLQPCDAHSR